MKKIKIMELKNINNSLLETVDYYALVNYRGGVRYYHVVAHDKGDIAVKYIDYNPNRYSDGVWIKNGENKIIARFSDTSIEYKYFTLLKEKFTYIVYDLAHKYKENQKTKFDWINKFLSVENGVALMPDRTSAPWWQHFADNCEGVLFTNKKIKFINEFGKVGESPSNGSTLFAIGEKGVQALHNAERNNLGKCFI